MAKNKNVGKPRNYALESGVYRFGKSKTYHKKAVYKYIKKKTAKKPVKASPTFVEKPVKGAKNGGTRMVRVKRLRNDVPTVDKYVFWPFFPRSGLFGVFPDHEKRVFAHFVSQFLSGFAFFI